MKFSLALTAVFLPIMVNAQYGGGGGDTSSTSTSSSAAAATSAASNNVNVVVSPGGALSFSPSDLTAANGTTVTFIFPSSVSHSVTQSSFADPCTYLAAANGSPGGFDSGLQTSKQFTIQITNDQEPVWFFCKAPTHCGTGMVGSINAPSSGNTAANFLAAAKAIGSNEKTVSDSGPVTGGVNAVATSTPTASSASSASSSTASKSSDAGRLVASGFFALVATALGITLA